MSASTELFTSGFTQHYVWSDTAITEGTQSYLPSSFYLFLITDHINCNIQWDPSPSWTTSVACLTSASMTASKRVCGEIGSKMSVAAEEHAWVHGWLANKLRILFTSLTRFSCETKTFNVYILTPFSWNINRIAFFSLVMNSVSSQVSDCCAYTIRILPKQFTCGLLVCQMIFYKNQTSEMLQYLMLFNKTKQWICPYKIKCKLDLRLSRLLPRVMFSPVCVCVCVYIQNALPLQCFSLFQCCSCLRCSKFFIFFYKAATNDYSFN